VILLCTREEPGLRFQVFEGGDEDHRGVGGVLLHCGLINPLLAFTHRRDSDAG